MPIQTFQTERRINAPQNYIQASAHNTWTAENQRSKKIMRKVGVIFKEWEF